MWWMVQKQMRGVESEEAENAGQKRERKLYPPPLLVVQNEEMRQRGVRDREEGREREMGTDKGSKQRNIHMRKRLRKSSNGRPLLNHLFTDLKLQNLTLKRTLNTFQFTEIALKEIGSWLKYSGKFPNKNCSCPALKKCAGQQLGCPETPATLSLQQLD